MRSSSQGVALLQVMLIFVVLSGIVIELGARQSRSLNNTQNWLEMGQLDAWRESVVALTKADLQRDFRSPLPEHYWHEWRAPLALDRGELWLRFTPLSHRFNLNWVQSRPWGLAALNTLLNNNNEPTEWADAMYQWMHAESELSQQLLLQSPPYAAAYHPLVDRSELTLLTPVLNASVALPSPEWTSILPAQSPLYIGDASTAVLMAIHSGIGEPQLQRLNSLRDHPQWVEVWLDSTEMASIKNDLKSEWFTARAQYFQVEAWLHRQHQNLFMTALIYRDKEGDMTLLGRHFLPIIDLPVDSQRLPLQN